MKKLVALLLAIIGLFSAAVNSTAETIDTPTETKAVEWAIGYHTRCAKYGKVNRHNYGKRVAKFARCVAFAPLMIFFGAMPAETSPNERYYTCLARGGTPEEAKIAYNAIDEAGIPKPKTRRVSHPKWAKTDPEKVRFLSAEDLSNATEANRGWMSISKLEGFDGTVVLVYQWFDKDSDNPLSEAPEQITYKGVKYILWCSSQGGVKKGASIYVKRSFMYTATNGFMNHVLLDAPEGLPVNKMNQVRALRFTACKPTEAKMSQVIVLPPVRRIDDAKDIVDGRPVVHVDVQNEYKISKADKVEQALDDGGGIMGPKCGIKEPAAQLRNDGGLKCAVIKYLSRHIGEVVIDCFGCKVTITEASIIVTTDCTKDIKPFLEKIKSGEMTGEEAKAAWLEAQGGPDAPIYQCSVHPQNGRVTLGRQLFGKLSQLSDDALFRVAGKDIGQLAELGFESGYNRSLQRKYAALRIPALSSLLKHPLLYNDTVRSYLSKWHKVASGGVEVNGALALAVIDPAWFDDVHLGGKDVNDPTAGGVKAGYVLFGTPDKNGENPYIGKEVVLGRFPQVKSGLPVVKVEANSYASGVIVVSGRPGDMVLQDLDADLDGDKFYVIDDENIVEAVKKANKIFNFPHVIFSKWDTVPAEETLAQYLGRNAQWQGDENVGSFATHQFVIDEMVPLLKDGEDWKKLLRPTLDENGDYSKYVTLEEIFELNILLGVAGNMATDSGKLNHKPDAPSWIIKKAAFRPMSQRDAHPNAIDSGYKKRHAAFLPDKYPGVDKGVLKRLHDMMMKYIPIEEVGRTEFNDFEYDENGRIIPDKPKTLWCPSGFEVTPEDVWRHKFGNDLDEIKTSLVCYPNEVEVEELNQDLQVFDNGEEGISLVTYFSKYATRIAAIESSLDDDKKGWTVAGRDTFGDNLIKFVQTATKRKDISAEDCLWLSYNALCQSFIGTQSQSRGTSFAISQFLKLFEGMLIQQVCQNTGSKAPKVVGEKVSIKDSVSKSMPEESSIELTDEEPLIGMNVDSLILQEQLLNEINHETTNEEPPAETVNVAELMKQLQTKVSGGWSISIDPSEDEYPEDDE